MTPPTAPGSCISTACSTRRSSWPAPSQPENTSIQHGSLGTSLNSTGGTNGFFAGVLDEVRVWNVVRTDAQIAAERDHALTSGTGLIARYGLDEGSWPERRQQRRRRTRGHAHQWPALDRRPAAQPAGRQPGAGLQTDITDQTLTPRATPSSSMPSATDPDFDTLTYSATGLPAGSRSTPRRGSSAAPWATPRRYLHGPVTVSDGSLTTPTTSPGRSPTPTAHRSSAPTSVTAPMPRARSSASMPMPAIPDGDSAHL